MSDSRIEELERMKVDNKLQVEQISKVLKTKQAQARTQNNVDASINTLIQTTQLIAEQSSKMASLALKTHTTYENDRKVLISQYSSLVGKVESQNTIFNEHVSELKSSVENAVALTSSGLKNAILPDIKKQIEGFEIEVGERIKNTYIELNQCRERVLNQSRFFSNFLTAKNIIMFALLMVLASMFVVAAGIDFKYREFTYMGVELLFGCVCFGLYFLLYKVFFAEY